MVFANLYYGYEVSKTNLRNYISAKNKIRKRNVDLDYNINLDIPGWQLISIEVSYENFKWFLVDNEHLDLSSIDDLIDKLKMCKQKKLPIKIHKELRLNGEPKLLNIPCIDEENNFVYSSDDDFDSSYIGTL